MKTSRSSPQAHAMRTAVFTSISCNYAAQASILLQSLAEFHPAWDRFLVLVDRPPDSFAFPSQVAKTVPVHAIVPDASVLWLASQPQMNACTAVKPFGFLSLLRQGYSRVIYLDPDICIYSKLHELERALIRSSIVLTPHIASLPEEDLYSFERIAPFGIFNLGFLALKGNPETLRLLEWWGGKCLTTSSANPLSGSYTDQRFFDLVPSVARAVTILRHAGYNIAYWNAHGRDLASPSDRRMAVSHEVAKVRFIHFSGCPKMGTRRLSRFDNRPSPLWIRPYLKDYQSRLRKAGRIFSRQVPYRLTLEELLGVSELQGALIRSFPNLRRSLAGATNPHLLMHSILNFMRSYLGRSKRLPQRMPSTKELPSKSTPAHSPVAHVFYCSDSAPRGEQALLRSVAATLRATGIAADLVDLSLTKPHPKIPLPYPKVCVLLPSCFAAAPLMKWWFLFQGPFPRLAIESPGLPPFAAKLVRAVVPNRHLKTQVKRLLLQAASGRVPSPHLRTIIAGAGSAGQLLALQLPPLFKLIAFSDRSLPKRVSQRGIAPIIPTEQIARLKPDIVLIASAFHEEIKKSLGEIRSLGGRLMTYDSLGMTRPD